MARFALAFVIPGAAVIGLALGGWWTWLGVVQSYVLFPLLDWIVPGDPSNPAAEKEASLSAQVGYRFLTISAVPIQVGVILYGGYFVATPGVTTVEIIGALLSVGISSGGFGIVVAHELMHQRRLERVLSRVLMSSVSYAHFCIEHVQGHHVHVATPADPASAPYGQGFYRFLLQTTVGSWRSAWRIEGDRLRRKGTAVLHVRNRMLQDIAITVALGLTAVVLWGWLGLVFFFGQSAISVLELEAINYIEHYGLRRRETSPGTFEATTSRHSWNTDRRLTNRALFNLGRHADHHNFAGRRYQVLRHEVNAPQMPAGYATMLLLAFVPPLWRRIMDPRVATAMDDPA